MTNRPSAFTFLICVLFLWGSAGLVSAEDQPVTEETPTTTEKGDTKPAKDGAEETSKPSHEDVEAEEEDTAITEDEEMRKAEDDEVAVAVARPLLADPVQVYGWREWVRVSDGTLELKLPAKLDTGALTSSIHAENKELFERDGKKWVRFVVGVDGPEGKRLRIEAPLVRIAKIKEPGGESEMREVVRLGFKIGDRKVRAEFTLNNRSNMLNPILIGRRTIKELGWVDSSRAYLADKKVMR